MTLADEVRAIVSRADQTVDRKDIQALRAALEEQCSPPTYADGYRAGVEACAKWYDRMASWQACQRMTAKARESRRVAAQIRAIPTPTPEEKHDG